MPWALLAFLLMPFGLDHLALVPMGWGIAGELGDPLVAEGDATVLCRKLFLLKGIPFGAESI